MQPMCSICGTGLPAKGEIWKCEACEAGPRQRAVAIALMRALGIAPKCLLDAKMDKSRRGLGISDAFNLAAVLAYKFRYVNSFYDEFPNIDLAAPPAIAIGMFEFVSCSDVLEHTMPPLEAAIDGLHRLLRAEGVLVVSVPVSRRVEGMEEKYPGLVSYSVQNDSPAVTVLGHFSDSSTRRLEAPVFHGGPGATLEIRRFAPSALPNLLTARGFEIAETIGSDDIYGVPHGTGPIILARKI